MLNLRGAADAGRSRTKIAAARRLGLAHADCRMSGHERLAPERAARLVTLIDSLPQPVPIHCKAGADRTGLANAARTPCPPARTSPLDIQAVVGNLDIGKLLSHYRSAV